MDIEFNNIILNETLPSIEKAFRALAIKANEGKIVDDKGSIENVLKFKTQKLKLILNRVIDSQSEMYSNIFKTE